MIYIKSVYLSVGDVCVSLVADLELDAVWKILNISCCLITKYGELCSHGGGTHSTSAYSYLYVDC